MVVKFFVKGSIEFCPTVELFTGMLVLGYSYSSGVGGFLVDSEQPLSCFRILMLRADYLSL